MAGQLVQLLMEQGGVATRAQLDLLLGEGQVVRRIRRGELTRLRRGVYALTAFATNARAEPRRSATVDVAAALVDSTKGSAGSHFSAGHAYGLQFLNRPPDLVTITRPPGSHRSLRDGKAYVAELPDHHVSNTGSVRMTTLARTVCDLARTVTFMEAVVIADSALRNGLKKRELEDVIQDCEGWPGIAQASATARFADKRSDSVPETVARVIFAKHGLPAPQLQAWVGNDDRQALVDFLWSNERTVAEVDGEVKFRDNRDYGARLLDRDWVIRDAGYEIVHLTYSLVVHRPQEAVARVRRAFELARR